MTTAIIDGKEIEFKCPKCGEVRIEEVMINVTVATEINCIKIYNEEDGELVEEQYGEQTNEDGELQNYQCMSCGHTIATSNEKLVEFFKGQV